MQVARHKLVDVFAIEIRAINLFEFVSCQRQNSELLQLSCDLKELVPAVEEVFIQI